MTQSDGARHRIFAGSLAQVSLGRVLTVRLSADAQGLPREAIVLADSAGVPRAYLNRCRHLPVPLDAASRRFVVDGMLECATHGARYRLEDGLCVSGPCSGQALLSLELELDHDDIYVFESTD